MSNHFEYFSFALFSDCGGQESWWTNLWSHNYKMLTHVTFMYTFPYYVYCLLVAVTCIVLSCIFVWIHLSTLVLLIMHYTLQTCCGYIYYVCTLLVSAVVTLSVCILLAYLLLCTLHFVWICLCMHVLLICYCRIIHYVYIADMPWLHICALLLLLHYLYVYC